MSNTASNKRTLKEALDLEPLGEEELSQIDTVRKWLKQVNDMRSELRKLSDDPFTSYGPFDFDTKAALEQLFKVLQKDLSRAKAKQNQKQQQPGKKKAAVSSQQTDKPPFSSAQDPAGLWKHITKDDSPIRKNY